MSNRERLTAAVRLMLTVALLVMVYRETGPWTTVFLALLALANEVTHYVFQSVTKALREFK